MFAATKRRGYLTRMTDFMFCNSWDDGRSDLQTFVPEAGLAPNSQKNIATKKILFKFHLRLAVCWQLLATLYAKAVARRSP